MKMHARMDGHAPERDSHMAALAPARSKPRVPLREAAAGPHGMKLRKAWARNGKPMRQCQAVCRNHKTSNTLS